jgi:phage replication O-like protein O
MANVQKENGHLQLANAIVEALAKTYLSSRESQIIFAIFRQTYGWHRKESYISNKLISQMTGINEHHVCSVMKRLVKRNMVIRKNKKVSFQKDYEKWKNVPNGVHLENVPNGVTKCTEWGTKNVPNGVTIKDKKEIILNKKGDLFFITLKEFQKHRQKNKKKMTEYAIYLLLRKLERMSTDESVQIKIMEQSIERGWQDVYPLKDDVSITDQKHMSFEEKVLSDTR